MKVWGLLCCLVLGTFVLSGQTTQTGKEDPDDIYQRLMEGLRAGDTSIDFRALRFACSDALKCEVRGNVTDLGALADAEGRSDWAAARQVAERLLSRGYADSETHASLVTIYAKLGDQKRSDFHFAVTLGLIKSIRTSWGETKQTALEIISSREMWTTMVSMGLPYHGDGVNYRAFTDSGHKYAVMDALDPKTNLPKQVYFNLDHVDAVKDVTDRP